MKYIYTMNRFLPYWKSIMECSFYIYSSKTSKFACPLVDLLIILWQNKKSWQTVLEMLAHDCPHPCQCMAFCQQGKLPVSNMSALFLTERLIDAYPCLPFFWFRSAVHVWWHKSQRGKTTGTCQAKVVTCLHLCQWGLWNFRLFLQAY